MLHYPETPLAHEAILLVLPPEEGLTRFPIHLMDLLGHEHGGIFTFNAQRTFGVSQAVTWDDFLDRYVKIGVGEDELIAYGRDLFKALIMESGLADSWSGIRSAAGIQPLSLTVEFSGGTEAVASLPLELLHDAEGFIFARPGCGIQRALLSTPVRQFVKKSHPRVLMAWACPKFAGHIFDPIPHVNKLTSIFGDFLEVLPQAGWQSLQDTLLSAQRLGRPFNYLYVLAHGYRDDHVGGLCLAGPSEARQDVSAQKLGQAVRDSGLDLAFLCSCQTAVVGSWAFSGVAQQLMARHGGDLSCVVATQANLPIRNSEVLVGRFFELLENGHQPAVALAKARREAFSPGGGPAWSVPILLTRPARAEVFASKAFVKGLPEKRKTYQPRDMEKDCVEALNQSRLVSLVGLPGIGKTEAGKEIARQAHQQNIFDRVIYQEVKPGFTPELLRTLLATALGQVGVTDDYALAHLMESQGQRLLIVLDNAEDLMKDPASEDLFRRQINTFLGNTSSLKILMTTRWAMTGTDIRSRNIEVPPMRHEEMSRLLADELKEMGVLRPEWIKTEPWKNLLNLLDGHPRSLWLASYHFQARPGADPAFVLSRLTTFREKAIVEPELFGRPDVFATLKDDQRDRLKSLVATMDLSYEVLEQQFPEAAEVYLGFSLFSAGLPENVAQEVAGGMEYAAVLYQIYRFHLVAWDKERVYNPVPLRWYAEKRRRERNVDEAKYIRRAIEAFAAYLETCDELITSGGIVAGVDRLLTEVATVKMLAEWMNEHGDHGVERCFSGRLANAAANGLMFTYHYQELTGLLSLALSQARKKSDRFSEANCLKSLGDLKMREDDLEGAGQAYEEALPIYREIRDRLGEANCLKSLGDLKMREDDLAGAGQAYEEALPIYREIRARLGEANCLKSLGDLKMRESDLEGAGQAYEEALPIYREIRDRLGEANCLQSLGLLELMQQRPAEAFVSFNRVLAIFQAIGHPLGFQSVLGYLARAAKAAGAEDQALLLAEESLKIGRAIRDRFGQTINLGQQAKIWVGRSEITPLLATVMILRELYNSMGNQADVERYSLMIDHLKENISAEEFQAVRDDPEAVRLKWINEAQDRFAQYGRQLLDASAPTV